VSFLQTVLLVVRKDLLIEARSREVLYTTLFFAVSCVLVFAFGFVREGKPLEDAAAGILWIAIAFSGTLALGRAFERERQSETLRALLVAPIDRPALYVGKLLGVLALLFAVELIVVPLVALDVPGAAVRFSAADAGVAGHRDDRVRGRGDAVCRHARPGPEPGRAAPGAAVPDYNSGNHRRGPGHGRAARGGSERRVARMWLSMLFFFDVVFVTLALWTFEPVMTE
jgi:ABC-type Na+ efflux pump permease subunit